MKTEIIQEFKGVINGIEIEDRNIFYSMEFILEQIERKFGECYNDKFVEDLIATIDKLYSKCDDFTFNTLESEFYNCIYNADKFENIEFDYYGSHWMIEILNDRLKAGEYNK